MTRWGEYNVNMIDHISRINKWTHNRYEMPAHVWKCMKMYDIAWSIYIYIYTHTHTCWWYGVQMLKEHVI